MGLGLSIVGEVAGHAAGELLSRAAAWLERHAADDLLHLHVAEGSGEKRTLCAGLHPSAEDLELTALDGGRVRASCKTSTTGPGYHAYVCELLDALGAAVGIRWLPPTEEDADETGYFHTRDAAALEREFLAWLGGLAGMLLEREAEGMSGFAISMPVTHRFATDAFLTTPVGPRSAAWVREVARDPRRGVDLFPWWAPGKGPAYALGRALVHIWQDVPWRPPVDGAETARLERVDGLLARAHAADPSLPLPWAEWAELLEHLGRARPEVSARAPSAPPPSIGYRRRDVWNLLTGGWSLTAPGAFLGRVDDEGTWSAFDGRLTLWFTSFSITSDGEPRPADQVLPTSPVEGTPVELPPLRGVPHRAYVTVRDDDDGEGEYFFMTTEVAAEGALALLNIAYPDESDQPLAARIAASLAHGR